MTGVFLGCCCAALSVFAVSCGGEQPGDGAAESSTTQAFSEPNCLHAAPDGDLGGPNGHIGGLLTQETYTNSHCGDAYVATASDPYQGNSGNPYSLFTVNWSSSDPQTKAECEGSELAIQVYARPSRGGIGNTWTNLGTNRTYGQWNASGNFCNIPSDGLVVPSHNNPWVYFLDVTGRHANGTTARVFVDNAYPIPVVFPNGHCTFCGRP